MTYERAAEILDPEHRETYESLEIVNEACRMGRAALFRRMPEPPHPDGDESILACPTCGSGEYLYNEDGNRCCFCGWCGQAIDWNAETFKAAGQMKPVLKYPGSKWRLRNGLYPSCRRTRAIWNRSSGAGPCSSKSRRAV